MRIDIVTLFPEMFEGFLKYSIPKRAQEKGLVEIVLHNLRDYSLKKSRSVDDAPYGGGAGMVIEIEPIANCIESLEKERVYDQKIFVTPDADVLDQPTSNTLSLSENLLIFCGHYKGIDERAREHFFTKEISIGNYVLSGGELAAAVVADAVIRLIPGVLNDETSALSDSFQDGLLTPPIYTRPESFRGWAVPEILLSGNDRLIQEWRYEKAVEKTRNLKPDLLFGGSEHLDKGRS